MSTSPGVPQGGANPTLPYWPVLRIPADQPPDTSVLTNSELEAPSSPGAYQPPPEGQPMALTSTPTHDVAGEEGAGETAADPPPPPFQPTDAEGTPSPAPSPHCEGAEEEEDDISITVLPLQTLPPALVLPLLYVSPAGLLTVLLRRQVAVEMTLDRALRVVNPAFRSVASTNSYGDASCIYHTGARLYQDHTLTEADIHWNRRAKLSTDAILFSDNDACYELRANQLYVALPQYSDLTKDMSVTLLFSSSGYGPQLLRQCQDAAHAATYEFLDSGATIVKINGVRIRQTEADDVVVTSGSKYLRVSPTTGAMSVCTHYVDMSVDRHSSVRVYRGDQSLHATPDKMVVSNGEVEAGIGGGGGHQRAFCYPLKYRLETLTPRHGRGGRGRSQHHSHFASIADYPQAADKPWRSPQRSTTYSRSGGAGKGSSWQRYNGSPSRAFRSRHTKPGAPRNYYRQS